MLAYNLSFVILIVFYYHYWLQKKISTCVQVHATYCANVKTTKIIIHRYFK